MAETKEEVSALIKEAIEMHLEDMRKEGLSIPPASSFLEYVDVAA